MHIIETSGYSLKGSFTPDLVYSKLWMARELGRQMEQHGIQRFPVAYILGSWYSNAAILLRKSGVAIDRIINVDINDEWLRTGQQITRLMNLGGIAHMNKDANRLDYRQLKKPALVINTSCNDIEDRGWFDRVPRGTVVVLQGRNRVPSKAQSFESLNDLHKQYPLRKVWTAGNAKLEDPETDYQRFLIIGLK